MSYILDALKKSEQDRQKNDKSNSLPVNWVAASETQTSSSLLPGLFLGILFASLMAILFWTMNAKQNTSEKITDDNRIVSGDRPESSSDMTSSAGKIAAVTPQRVKTITVESEVATRPPGPQPKPRLQPKTDPVDVTTHISSAEVKRSERVLPPLTVLKKIPDLIITGHIYSSVADKRSVSINGREWNEGDYLSDNIRVKEITADGVVINIEGWNLPLKRNKGWQAIP